MKKFIFFAWILSFHIVNAAFVDGIPTEPFPGFFLFTLILILCGLLLVIWAIVWIRTYNHWTSSYENIWRFWRFYLFILANYILDIKIMQFHKEIHGSSLFLRHLNQTSFSIGVKLYDWLHCVSYIGIWIILTGFGLDTTH